MTLTVAEVWRYPVKSMQGERVATTTDVTDAGLAGDRGYAVVDPEIGKVGSAKHPRLWGSLLHCEARYAAEPTADRRKLPAVVITLPDGTETGSDDPDVDRRLSDYIGRPVQLTSKAPKGSDYLAVWPEFDGVMPDAIRQGSAVATTGADGIAPDQGEGTLAHHAVSLAAPEGTFFDVCALHLVTTATLDKLGSLAPDTAFPAQRFRPNVVIDAGDAGDDLAGFAENDWTGKTIALGGAGLTASVLGPTMRCIMTTLAQPGLARDNNVLKTITTHNRLDLPGMGGVWSCVGAYAVVAAGGSLTAGDAVTL
jgi:hypothetical protein